MKLRKLPTLFSKPSENVLEHLLDHVFFSKKAYETCADYNKTKIDCSFSPNNSLELFFTVHRWGEGEEGGGWRRVH
jgi:hypothetical protein